MGEPFAYRVLGQRRPGFGAAGVDDMDHILVLAEDARAGETRPLDIAS